MHFGLNAQDWALLEQILIQPMKSKGAQLWVFGSRVTRKHRPFSDLDVLVHLPAGFDPYLISQIQETLEESLLPIKVDLVLEENLATAYKDQIYQERVALV